jgi:transposase
MFIKAIPKTDRSTGKKYNYFRLCESYRVGEKTRHRMVLSLGTLNGLTEIVHFKILADRIEQLINGSPALFSCDNPEVEKLAQAFYQEIISKKLVDRTEGSTPRKNIQSIDLESVEVENVREIGSEWLCYQVMNQLDMRRCLEQAGFDEEDIRLSLMHLISRAVYPASEHATAEWVKDNSGVCELVDIDPQMVSHHKLYRISRLLHHHKEQIEGFLSKKTSELFDIQDRIILYDLTNTYFEGRKLNSKMAMFGASKEKRSDARLITLALVVNVEGFVKYSHIYRGNIGEPTTLEATIEDIRCRMNIGDGRPMIIMDAGIATEENLDMLKNREYDYLCVSRSRLRDYKAVKQEGVPVTIYDKRKSRIELLLVEKEGLDDTLLYVRSERKAQKELSMQEHFTSHFEQGLNQILYGIQCKGGTKKLVKVWERLGRLKEKYPSAHRFYQIEIESKGNIATNIVWKKIIPKSRKEEGAYLLRTSKKDIDEKTFWDIYNTIRDIESTFRTLKTDLQIRPVFHQKDENTMSHLNLAVLAYQCVNAIRYQLKAKGIHHDWSHIVRLMNTHKVATVTMLDKSGRKIYMRKCSKPDAKALEIYDALGFKYYPFYKKSVFPESGNRKNESHADSIIPDT